MPCLFYIMKKALVTGGTGFIGSHLVERLVRDKWNVVVIDDLSLGKEENLSAVKEKIGFYKKSICDDLSNIFEKEKFDYIFHVAALPRVQFSIANPIITHEVNVNGTLNLLDLCKKHNLKRFVFSSSSSVYGEQKKMPLNEEMENKPISPYALHKLIGEYYCQMFNLFYGVETISLRYFNVYGERQNAEGGYACLIPKFTKMFLRGSKPVINGDGEQTRDFTYVGDVIDANILAAQTQNKESFGKAFNIGNGDNKSINYVTKKIKEILLTETKVIHGPPVIEPKHTLASISKAREFLGWAPKSNFDEKLKITVESFKD